MALDFLRTGSGPPLVLIHGLGGTGGLWDPVVERLEAHRDVIVPDLPGFGGSDVLQNGTAATAGNLAAPVAALCAELGVQKPDVAGNSLGAWVCLELAKRGAARSVVGISPAGLWPDALGPRRVQTQRLGRRLRPLLKAALATERGKNALLRTTVAEPERVSRAAARELVLGYLDAPGYEVANAAMRAEPFEHEGKVEVPVTLAWGEADRLVGPPSRSRVPPGARVLSVPGWGHTPTWDDPDGVARLLLEASAGAGSK
jgi:pimeloyl-ACP methyl ester carboxylesterase